MNLNPNKLVFVHVPKCAGSSMAKALQADKDHTVYHCATNRSEEWLTKLNPDNRRRVLEFDSSWYAFAFVRNPFDRIISAWKTSWLPWPSQGNLIDFLEYIDKTDDEFAKSHVCPFLDPRQKLFNEDGTQRVNFIGRYENLQEDFNLVCSNMSLGTINLPHENRGRHKWGRPAARIRHQDFYNHETRSIVEKKYAKDLEYFGYEFGE